MSGLEPQGYSPGLRVSPLGAAGGGQRAGKELGQATRGGQASPPLGGQASCIPDSAQQEALSQAWPQPKL